MTPSFLLQVMIRRCVRVNPIWLADEPVNGPVWQTLTARAERNDVSVMMFVDWLASTRVSETSIGTDADSFSCLLHFTLTQTPTFFYSGTWLSYLAELLSLWLAIFSCARCPMVVKAKILDIRCVKQLLDVGVASMQNKKLSIQYLKFFCHFRRRKMSVSRVGER